MTQTEKDFELTDYEVEYLRGLGYNNWLDEDYDSEYRANLFNLIFNNSSSIHIRLQFILAASQIWPDVGSVFCQGDPKTAKTWILKIIDQDSWMFITDGTSAWFTFDELKHFLK